MARAQQKVPATEIETEYSDITRYHFPKDFIFGTGTAAYQHEGGATTGGRGISVWDVFTLRTPGNIIDGSNGNIAVDMYNKYEEDIKMMKCMGFDAYRFSISWPRILPGGKICLGVNREGIDYYNKLINTLIDNKITPYVTLFHWDLPYALEQEYDGFLSEDIVKDFCEFADLCFWEFGDRVKHWFTFNEPWTYCYRGYVDRNFPPTEVIVAPKAGSGSEATDSNADASADAVAANLARHITAENLHSVPNLSAPAIVPKSLVPAYDSPVSANVAEITKNLLAMTQSPEEVNRLMDICNRAMGKNKKCFNSYRCGNFTAPIEDSTSTIASKMMLRVSLFSADRNKYSHDDDHSMTEEDKEAFIAAKYMLLAHAAAVELYKTKYQKHQKGQIGITLVSHWFEPKFNKTQDEEAARRTLDFMLGWFLEPILIGCYPKNMEKYVPYEAQFSAEESEMLKKHKIDFLGLNYYTARYVKNVPNPETKYQHAYKKYQFATQYQNKKKKPIGEAPGAKWLNIVPWGIKKLLKKVNELYNNSTYKLPPVFITENGMADVSNHRLTAYEACVDKKRVKYFQDHLGNILDVIKETKMPIKGYFAWSWSDNFEWTEGYTYRFGIIYIDYVNHLKRHPKHSAMWFAHFLVKEDEKPDDNDDEDNKDEKPDDNNDNEDNKVEKPDDNNNRNKDENDNNCNEDENDDSNWFEEINNNCDEAEDDDNNCDKDDEEDPNTNKNDNNCDEDENDDNNNCDGDEDDDNNCDKDDEEDPNTNKNENNCDEDENEDKNNCNEDEDDDNNCDKDDDEDPNTNKNDNNCDEDENDDRCWFEPYYNNSDEDEDDDNNCDKGDEEDPNTKLK